MTTTTNFETRESTVPALPEVIRSRPTKAQLRGRAREVVSSMMLAGLDVPLARVRLSSCASWRCRVHCTWRRWTGRSAPESDWYRATRDALVELGPAFVKIGQILSVRADLVPPQLSSVLRSLQSDVPPVPFREVRETLSAAIEGPLDEYLESIDETPLAAGSIAQVHLARLASGQQVALKVKRPGIDEVVRLDLAVLRWLAEKAERNSPMARGYRPVAAAEELSRYTLRELDFRQEANVARRLREHHADDDRVRIPEIHFASGDLIVMEYIESFAADEPHSYATYGLDPHDVMRVGISAVISEIFDLGLFHGDPHPGNLHVTADGELVLLDFGIFGELDDRTRRRCALAMWALVRGDIELASLHLVQMTRPTANADVVAFRNAVEEKYKTWRDSKALDYGLGRLVFDAMSLAARHGLELPSDAILVGKALTTVEGLILWVDPEVDMNAELRPYLTEVARRLFDPRLIFDEVVRSLPTWWDILERLPSGLAHGLQRTLEPPRGSPPPARPGPATLSLAAIALLAFGVASLNAWWAIGVGAGALAIQLILNTRRGR